MSTPLDSACCALLGHGCLRDVTTSLDRSSAPAGASAGATAPSGSEGPAHPRAILAIILVSYFLILLDNSVIFTGLPSIASAMDLGAAGLSWVQDAYTLVFGGLLLLGARLGDLLGRRRVFVAGLAVFVTASFLIGVAPAGWWLIAGRALQGVGAAVVAPSALSLLTASFPEGPQRSRAVAWYAATAGIGASLGMLVGGAAAQWISWRAGFFINVPLGIAMAVLAPRYLPATRPQPGRFDLTGALAATVGVGALVFGIIESADRGWTDPVVVAALVVAAAVLAVLVLHERRAEQPIMPLRLFADRRRSGAYAARALYLGAMIGFFFFTTQLMQDVLGFSAFGAGLGFLPMTVVNFAVATLLPRVARRYGEAPVLVAGVASDPGRDGLARAGRVQQLVPDGDRAADGAHRCRPGPGLRAADQLRHRRGPVRGRRRGQRTGEHRPPARHGHRPRRPGHGLRARHGPGRPGRDRADVGHGPAGPVPARRRDRRRPCAAPGTAGSTGPPIRSGMEKRRGDLAPSLLLMAATRRAPSVER